MSLNLTPPLRETAVLLFFLLLAGLLSAQDTTWQYRIYPGLAPAMIEHRQVEVNLFNVLSTLKYDQTVQGVEDRLRSTALVHFLQLTYGLTPSRRFNVGADLNYLHTRVDSDESSSPFAVLGGDADETSTTYHTLSAAGVRVRALPFAGVPEFMVQSSLLFPTASSDLPRVELDIARTQWLVQGSFYQQISPWLHGFLSLGGYVKFQNGEHRETSYGIPANLLAVVRLIDHRLYFYPNLNYAVRFKKGLDNLKRENYQFLYGLGLQYYLSQRFMLSLDYQRPISYDLGRPSVEPVDGSFYTVNLGIRYVSGW